MKKEISALDLYYLVKEFQVLIDGKINQVYQNADEFLFQFHVPSTGKKMLKISLPSLIYLTNYKEEFPDTPPGYCQFLRKYLKNTRVRKIEQKNFERIIEITFESKDKILILIIELFSKGNIILCNEDYKIMSPFKNQNWKDRTIRGGTEYEFPPKQINSSELSEKEFQTIIEESEKDSLVKILAMDLNLGGIYSEELCFRSKLNKEKKEFSKKELSALYKHFKELLEIKLEPNFCDEEIFPFNLLMSEQKDREFFETFNQVLDEKLTNKTIKTHKETQEKKKTTKTDKVLEIINQQEQTIKGMGISADENQKKGEFIYEHYEEIKDILLQMNKAREKLSWKEIKEKLKGNKKIKSINEKEATITIELK